MYPYHRILFILKQIILIVN